MKAAAEGSPQRLSLGAKFQIAMKRGVAYSMVNTVTEFDENRRNRVVPQTLQREGEPLGGSNLAL